MAVKFTCNGCGQLYQVDSELAGRRMKCKKCGVALTIPAGDAARAAPPRPQLKSFGEPDAAPKKKPILQSFGGDVGAPALPGKKFAPTNAPKPASGARSEEAVVDYTIEEVLDDPDSAPDGAYALDDDNDNLYAPPKAPLEPPEDAPPRPGQPDGKKKRKRQYATVWSRFCAMVADNIIVFVIQFCVGFAIGFGAGASGMVNTNDQQSMFKFKLILQLVGILIAVVYFAGMESSSTQATLGKQMMGIKVIDLNGNRISFLRAVGRFFAKIISGIILLIGYIMAFFTEKKQALHDVVAGTLVVKS